MKYLTRGFLSTAVCTLVLLGMMTGCGTIDTSGQIRYSGMEVIYNNSNAEKPISNYINKIYIYNENYSTFTLSDGSKVFTFAGSHPQRDGGGGYSGTYSDGRDRGTAFVGFQMGIHMYYHLNKDTSTFTAFDGSLQ